MPDGTEFAYADDELAMRSCFDLMRELRPHLASPDEFVESCSRQRAGGYRLLVLREGGKPVALAGFRVQENLVHGRHLYVDDLVTSPERRGHGYGHIVMDRIRSEAAGLGCDRISLDTPTSNVLGHRFYYRQGFLATAFRFLLIPEQASNG